MKVLVRESYLALLRREKDKQSLKLISGMKGSGKTATIALFAKECKKGGGNIVYLDLSDKKNEQYLKITNLLSYCYAHYEKSKRNYLFIEGAELFPEREVLMEKLYRQRRFDVYLLSSLVFPVNPTYRTYRLEIRPFSYHEFLRASGNRNDEKALERYIRYGGLPALLDEKIFARKGQYAKRLFKNILDRVIRENAVKYEELLTPLALYMCEHEGEEVSSHSLALALSEKTGKKYNHHTVSNYLEFLEKSHFLTKIPRYDMRKGALCKTKERYVLADPILSFAYSYGDDPFSQRSLLNLVIRELLYKGLEVNIAKVYNDEVGIYAHKGKGKILLAYVEKATGNNVDAAIDKLYYTYEDGEKVILTKERRPVPKRESAKVISIYDWLLIDRKRG